MPEQTRLDYAAGTTFPHLDSCYMPLPLLDTDNNIQG